MNEFGVVDNNDDVLLLLSCILFFMLCVFSSRNILHVILKIVCLNVCQSLQTQIERVYLFFLSEQTVLPLQYVSEQTTTTEPDETQQFREREK